MELKFYKAKVWSKRFCRFTCNPQSFQRKRLSILLHPHEIWTHSPLSPTSRISPLPMRRVAVAGAASTASLHEAHTFMSTVSSPPRISRAQRTILMNESTDYHDHDYCTHQYRFDSRCHHSHHYEHHIIIHCQLHAIIHQASLIAHLCPTLTKRRTIYYYLFRSSLYSVGSLYP